MSGIPILRNRGRVSANPNRGRVSANPIRSVLVVTHYSKIIRPTNRLELVTLLRHVHITKSFELKLGWIGLGAQNSLNLQVGTMF